MKTNLNLKKSFCRRLRYWIIFKPISLISEITGTWRELIKDKEEVNGRKRGRDKEIWRISYLKLQKIERNRKIQLEEARVGFYLKGGNKLDWSFRRGERTLQWKESLDVGLTLRKGRNYQSKRIRNQRI